MPFDPAFPADDAIAYADEQRAQFNALKALIDAANAHLAALAAQIAAIPAGAPGPQGPPGPPISSPLTSPAVFDAPVYLGNQQLKFDMMRDIGGSGEWALRLSGIASSGGPMLAVAGRMAGADRYEHHVDFGGLNDGGGMPTVQDGDLLRFDGMSQIWKPWHVTVRTVQVLDENGNPITIQVLVPPP